MKNFFYAFAIVMVSCLISCKKDDNGSGDPATARVKTYTEDYTSGIDHVVNTFNLNYDSDGRLTSMVATGNSGDRFQLSYEKNTVTMELYAGHELALHTLCFLNTQNNIDSTIQYNNTNDFSSERYFYNSQNRLSRYIEYDYYGPIPEITNVSDYTFDANGNIAQVKDRFSLTTYEYFTEYRNAPNLGFPSFPKSENLVKSTTMTFGYTPQVWNHTYTFDTKKRLTSETISSSTGEVLVKSYTY